MAKRVTATGPVDGPWALPDGWRWERIDSVAPVNPRRASDNLADDVEVAFVPMAAVTAETGGIDVSTRRPIASVRKGFTRFGSGDVIFAKITPCMENGKAAVVPTLPHGVGFGSTEFHVLSPRDVSARFLYHWISQRGFRETAEFNMTGTAGQKRVPTDFMRDALIPVPPPEVQAAIVARIDELFAEVDDGEAALGRARADLATWRKALLKAAVTGELTADWRAANPSVETGADLLARILADRRARWEAEAKNKGKQYAPPVAANSASLPTLPSSWTWGTIDQLSTRVTKGSSPGWQGFEYQHDGILFVRSQNVGWGRLLLDERVYLDPGFNKIESKAIIRQGDVLLNIVGASIGRACVADGRLNDANSNQAVAGIRPVSTSLSDWITAWLVSPAGQAAVFENVVETARANLSLEQVRAIPIPLPPDNERAAVLALYGQSIDMQTAMVTEVSEQSSTATTLRQSILAAAFRGDLA